MQQQEHRRGVRRMGCLARLLALVPVSCALLYPFYKAGKLMTRAETRAFAALPNAFSGLRAVFLSDIHYGVYLEEDRVRALVERVNALSPDLILLGGDYGETSDGAIDFFKLRPAFKATYGVLAAVGNHDRTVPDDNLERLMDEMRACGVTPLVNSAARLTKNGRTLAVVGVDDYYNGFPDMKRAFAQAAGADFVIFMPHTPDILPQAFADGYPFDLALCGHTHGGQVVLFGHALHSSSEYGSRYRAGWLRENNTDILVSTGVGTSFLPVRLGTESQIHCITLESEK